MSTLKSIDPALKQAPRPTSEVENELGELERARARLEHTLASFLDHLQSSGALIPPCPEEALKQVGEDMPASALGSRIRLVRNDLHSVANDFDRLLARLAI